MVIHKMHSVHTPNKARTRAKKGLNMKCQRDFDERKKDEEKPSKFLQIIVFFLLRFF